MPHEVYLSSLEKSKALAFKDSFHSSRGGLKRLSF